MALEITLLKQPYEVSFTGNPMPFVFALSPYGSTERAQEIKLQVRILVEQAFGSNVFTEAYNQNFYPDGYGKFTMDVRTVVDPYLDYYQPRPGLKLPVDAANQRKRYKISYLLTQDGAIVTGPTTTGAFYAVKGGMAYEQWHPSEFFTQKIVAGKKPLHFAAAGEKVSLTQPLYFWWCYPVDDLADQSVVFTFTLDDSTTVTYTLPGTINTGKWGICCAPAGFAQIDTGSLIPAGKLIVSYTVQVKVGSTVIVSPVTYTVDHRAFYDVYHLLYRNSVGGLDAVRLRGQVDFEADYLLQNATRTVPPSYWSNQNLLPQQVQDNTLETAKFTGDTGFLSLETINRLRDLFLSPQVYELYDSKYLPVVTLNKSVKFYANKDSLLSVQVQWQRAFANEYYTPQGFMPATRSCPALESFVVKQLNKNTLLVMYALASPYDKIQVLVQNGTSDEDITAVYTGNSGSIQQTFTNPADSSPATITIKGRTICDDDNSPADYGPYTTITLSVTGNSAPVANNDTYSIASGSSSSIILSGSVLGNDYDPDGDTISVTPDSGTTTAGGSYSIDAAGIVTYTPPSSAYIGNDTFDYEISDGTITSTATVTIKVGNTNVVYARAEYRNTVITAGPTVNGEVWLFFYANPTGSSPVDVSALGLTINVRKHTHTQNEFGATTDTDTDSSYAVYGTSYKIYTGLIAKNEYHSGWATPRITSYNWVVRPGSGYIPA